MTKAERLQIYNKYGGREIEYKDMQVDHIMPKRIDRYDILDIGINDIRNKNPSCRRCNHYKRAHTLEYFRKMLLTLHQRVRDIYICKIAEDYGIIKVQEWDGRFWFEREKTK